MDHEIQRFARSNGYAEAFPRLPDATGGLTESAKALATLDQRKMELESERSAIDIQLHLFAVIQAIALYRPVSPCPEAY